MDTDRVANKATWGLADVGYAFASSWEAVLMRFSIKALMAG